MNEKEQQAQEALLNLTPQKQTRYKTNNLSLRMNKNSMNKLRQYEESYYREVKLLKVSSVEKWNTDDSSILDLNDEKSLILNQKTNQNNKKPVNTNIGKKRLNLNNILTEIENEYDLDYSNLNSTSRNGKAKTSRKQSNKYNQNWNFPQTQKKKTSNNNVYQTQGQQQQQQQQNNNYLSFRYRTQNDIDQVDQSDLTYTIQSKGKKRKSIRQKQYEDFKQPEQQNNMKSISREKVVKKDEIYKLNKKNIRIKFLGQQLNGAQNLVSSKSVENNITSRSTTKTEGNLINNNNNTSAINSNILISEKDINQEFKNNNATLPVQNLEFGNEKELLYQEEKEKSKEKRDLFLQNIMSKLKQKRMQQSLKQNSKSNDISTQYYSDSIQKNLNINGQKLLEERELSMDNSFQQKQKQGDLKIKIKMPRKKIVTKIIQQQNKEIALKRNLEKKNINEQCTLSKEKNFVLRVQTPNKFHIQMQKQLQKQEEKVKQEYQEKLMKKEQSTESSSNHDLFANASVSKGTQSNFEEKNIENQFYLQQNKFYDKESNMTYFGKHGDESQEIESKKQIQNKIQSPLLNKNQNISFYYDLNDDQQYNFKSEKLNNSHLNKSKQGLNSSKVDYLDLHLQNSQVQPHSLQKFKQKYFSEFKQKQQQQQQQYLQDSQNLNNSSEIMMGSKKDVGQLKKITQNQYIKVMQKCQSSKQMNLISSECNRPLQFQNAQIKQQRFMSVKKVGIAAEDNSINKGVFYLQQKQKKNHKNAKIISELAKDMLSGRHNNNTGAKQIQLKILNKIQSPRSIYPLKQTQQQAQSYFV